MDKLLIITGGSKGIGNGIVNEYSRNGYAIISVSRTKNTHQDFEKVNQVIFDLSHVNEVENLLKNILEPISLENLTAITLINNAGKLGAITTIERKSAADIDETIRLNTTVPLILISSFLALTKSLNCRKKIINISSGAAKNPMHGWVTYCASKSAIDMITRAVATEQDALENGAKIISIYPGVVDTEMQSQIRESSKEDFVNVEKFLNYKENGVLATPDHVGKEIYKLDYDETLENGTIIRVPDNR